jgi:hypothetical protein
MMGRAMLVMMMMMMMTIMVAIMVRLVEVIIVLQESDEDMDSIFTPPVSTLLNKS